ncbi:lipopolysaccharide biosynthesis protein RfbH [soil metagenome]
MKVTNKKNARDFRVPYALAVFGKEELQAVTDVMKTPMIVPGRKVKEFENKIAGKFSKKFGIMVNSGSSANLIALELLKLPKGSEVITPVLTFGTTISPIFQKGLIPAFVDVESGTYQIDASKVEKMITKKTKAIMVPSLIGNIPDYDKLRKIANRYKLYLIEDSCDTLGSKINDKLTGTYSDISTTSFYASHVITTGGHGGMLCFNKNEWFDRAKTLVGWGRSSAKNETESIEHRFKVEVDGIPYDAKFVFEEVGYNFQSTDIDAAFGLAQFKKLQSFSNKRKRNFKTLYKYFKKYEDIFILPKQNKNVDTCWLAFPLTIKDGVGFQRRELVTYLEENNIQTRPLFTGNVLRQPAFKNLESRKSTDGYPVADKIMESSFVIGCHQGITYEHISYLKQKFDSFLRRYI